MIAWLNDQSVTEVECLVSDIAGIPRGKILPVHKFIGAAAVQGLRKTYLKRDWAPRCAKCGVRHEEIEYVKAIYSKLRDGLHPAESYVNSDNPRIRGMVSRLVELGFNTSKV